MSCLVPGMNERLGDAGLTPSARVTVFMLPAVMAPSLFEHRLSLLPITYPDAARHITAQSFDLALAHVAPPDEQGRCSLGIANDFASLAWRKARRRVAVVNPSMPRLPRALSIRADEADLLVTLESDLVTQEERPAGETAEATAERVAALVPDRARVQAGI